MQNYDIIIIGGGPGGYVAAIRAAQLGAKVALIEKDQVGGTCLNRGCIPTKAILASISLYEKMKKAANYGISASDVTIDYKQVIERKNKIVTKLVKGVEFLLKKNGVELIRGVGKVLEAGKVSVELGTRNLELATKNIILATGSSPISLPGIQFDGKKYFNSEQMLDNTEVPAKLNIVGGGVIGLEFAQIYSSLGTEVTIYEALPEILSGVDSEVVQLLKRTLKRKKVNILTNSKFNSSENDSPTLICIGRKPNQQATVNSQLETRNPGTYAIGDVVSKKQLAHVAYEQGVIAAENAMGGNRKFSDEFIPYGIFTDPEIGSVGATEGPKIGKFPFAALGIAQAKGEIEGFIKVVSDETGKLLGVHIIGPDATNLIGAAVVAIKNGLTVEQLAETFQAHPSFPEGLQEASLATLKRAVHGGN